MKSNLETQGLYDIYDIMYTPWYKQWWFIGVVAFCVLFFAYLCVRFFLTKKSVQRQYDVYEKALQRIAVLEKNFDSDAHIFYAMAIRDIKEYLQERYDVEVVSATDDEVIDCLEKALVDQALIEMIKKLFKGVVLIKFAHQSAEKEQKLQTIRLMRDSIAHGRSAAQLTNEKSVHLDV